MGHLRCRGDMLRQVRQFFIVGGDRPAAAGGFRPCFHLKLKTDALPKVPVCLPYKGADRLRGVFDQRKVNLSQLHQAINVEGWPKVCMATTAFMGLPVLRLKHPPSRRTATPAR